MELSKWLSLNDRRKGYSDNLFIKAANVDLQVDDGKAQVVATVSTDDIDRDDEIVVPKGMDFTDFRKAPAVYFNHNTSTLAIGKCLWIKALPDAIVAKYQISVDAGDDQKAIWQLIKDGVYTSHSIGFLSFNPTPPTPNEIKKNPSWAGASLIHRETSLLEFSVVGMPANTNALAMAISKSWSAEGMKIIKGNSGPVVEDSSIVEAQADNMDYRLKFYESLYRRLSH